MHFKCAVFLMTFFVFATSVGCGGKGAQKRAAITGISKTQTDKDSPQEPQTGSPQDDQQPPVDSGNTPPLPGKQDGFDSQKSDEILAQLSGLMLSSTDADASTVEFDSLKNLSLELEQIVVSFKNISMDGKKSFTALSLLKAEFDPSSGQLSFKSSPVATGSSEDLNLLALPILDRVQFDERGKAQVEKSNQFTLAPTVEKNSIKVNNESDGKVLEGLFDEMFFLPLEEVNGVTSRLSSTGVDLITKIEKTKDRVSFLIEILDGESMVQTFLITFKTTDTAVKKEVTE